VRTHDKKHILKHLDKSVNFKDITDDFACFGIFGPKSRELLMELFGEYFSNNDFKFGTGKNIIKDNIEMWFQRISYVGELGWEIYIPIQNSKEIYELIIKLEKKFGLVHAGAHAMDIMRMEKGYLHWGHDISPAENPYEAGLRFALKLNKKEDFIGKNFLIKIVGETTSGNYSFIYNKNLAYGYVNDKINFDISNSVFEIEVAKKKYKASVLKNALHDPENKFMKY
jgi:4-methylaminobutanoate oxidase (formaldehyde-forming)